MASVLQLRYAAHPSGFGYEDIYINGKRLADTVNTRGNIPPFGWTHEDFDLRSRRMLLLEEPGEWEDRIPLFVCDHCADYLCGFFSAKVSQIGDTIIWQDLRMSYFDYSPPDNESTLVLDKNPKKSGLRFTFDLAQYRDAILTRS